MTTRKIDVGRIKGNFYGGLPYAANWDFNDGSSPSTLSVSVVNSRGIYPEIDNDLTYSKKVTVGLGEFTFVGYLVSYSIDKTPEQKILNLEYVDSSADLDRYYVGLYKRHGRQTGESTNLIIVGKEYNPCDSNRDSTVSWNETAPVVDACDPCPSMPSDKYQSSCTDERVNFEIWEVAYTFNELLSKLPFNIISPPKNINTNYTAQHTGTVKDVLGAWCGELGLAYYWDPFNGGLAFVDRSKPLSPPKGLDQKENVIDYKYGATKKNTFSRGFIGYLAKQGQIKSYECKKNEKDSFEDVEALTIADLLDPESHPQKNEIALREMRVVLSRYGKPMRDAYIWFYYYAMTTALQVNNYKYDANTESGSAKVIDALGKMKILQVYHPSIQDEKSGDFPALCRQLLHKTEFDALEEADKRAGLDPVTDPSWYFFVAEVDDEFADSQYQIDQDLAQNYLGKYWYKYYNTPIPGATNDHTQVETDTPDGSNANWYISRSDVSNLDLFTHGHEENSKVGKLAKTVIDDSKKKWTNQSETKITAVDSFLLVDRPPKFIPINEQIEDYDSLFKWYQQYTPRPMGVDGRCDMLYSIYPEAAKNENIKLFFARQWGGFKINIEQEIPHPLEPDSMTMKKRIEENSLGNQITINIGEYGLRNNKCSRVTVSSAQAETPYEEGTIIDGRPATAEPLPDKVDMVIYLPPGSIKSKMAGTQADADEETGPGGDVVTQASTGRTPAGDIESPERVNPGDIGMEQDGGAFGGQGSIGKYRVFVRPSASFPKVIPKVQYTLAQSASTTDVAKLDYNYKELQEENVNSITQSQSCVPSADQLRAYVETIGQTSAYSMNSPQKTVSIKLPGIVPEIFGIHEALSSIQINISENSSYTTYNFEDKVIQPPSDEYIMNQLLLDRARGLKSLGSNSFTTAQVNQVSIGLST